MRIDRASEIRWPPKSNSSANGRSAWLEQNLCVYVQRRKPAIHGRVALANNTLTTMWSGSQSMMTSDERGNFCGNSRLVRKLTHSIYGHYLQIAALEQRVHATGHRINSAHRECPYSSIFANMWAFCALESEQFTRLAEVQCSQLIDENLCFGSAVSQAKFLTGTQRNFILCWKRTVDEYKLRNVCLKNVDLALEATEFWYFSDTLFRFCKVTHRTCRKLTAKYHQTTNLNFTRY